MSLAAFGHRLVPALIGVLVVLCALPRIHGHAVLLVTVAGLAVLMGLWHLALWRGGARREIIPNLKPNHYVQLVCHISIYIWWGTKWPQVGLSVPLMIAEVAFAFLFEMALCWTRGVPWRAGFGPIPITLSMNLFLWFKDDWYYWQFPMLALAFLSKEFIQWNRDGIRRHIFNPSAFALATMALFILPMELTYTTWGEEIAVTQATPANMYVVLFALGLIVHFRFPIVVMTMSAVAGCVLFQHLHYQQTGIHIFVDTTVPAAVFLGMNFLFTDPMTSPRSTLGKIIFGFAYGSLVVFEYIWLQKLGHPAIGDQPPTNVTYFDKLIQVPLLNLSVPLLDFIGRKLPLEKLKLNLEIPTVRYAFLGLWIPVFLFGFLPGMADHPGRRVGYWSDKCDGAMADPARKGDPSVDPFCRNLALLLRDSCNAGRVTPPTDCNLLGTMYEDGVGVGRNDDYAARLHEKACEGSLPVACSDLGLMVLEGRGGPADAKLALDLFKRSCDGESADGCQNYGAVLGQRHGGDPARVAEAKAALSRAGTLYTRACEAGDKEACQRIEEIKAGNRAPPSEQP